MFMKLADNSDPSSLASRLRAKRLRWFTSLLDSIPRPLSILDVGGTETIWERAGLVNRPDVSITLINIELRHAPYANVSAIVGDARDMRSFEKEQFDIVYSNSVIEHVGGLDDMRRMASEVRRVGKSYFVQTPNKYFPIEPHFHFPLYQFLPRGIKVAILQNFDLGWVKKAPDRLDASKEVDSIRLISGAELHSMFPDGEIRKETVLGLTKSLIAYKTPGHQARAESMTA